MAIREGVGTRVLVLGEYVEEPLIVGTCAEHEGKSWRHAVGLTRDFRVWMLKARQMRPVERGLSWG